MFFTCFGIWQNKEYETDRKRLTYNENLEFMPFGKSFIFMLFGNYAIWEVTQSFDFNHQQNGFCKASLHQRLRPSFYGSQKRTFDSLSMF